MQEIASVGMTRGGEALTVDVAGLAAEHGHGKKSELREHMRQSGFVLVVQGKRRPLRAECPRGPSKRAGAEIIARTRRRAPHDTFAYLRPHHRPRARAAIAARDIMA